MEHIYEECLNNPIALEIPNGNQTSSSSTYTLRSDTSSLFENR